MTTMLARRLARLEETVQPSLSEVEADVAALAPRAQSALRAMAHGEALSSEQDSALDDLFAISRGLPADLESQIFHRMMAGLSIAELRVLAVLPEDEAHDDPIVHGEWR